MTKFKKSLLSVAASVAISSTVLSAGYIPLNSTNYNDNQWVLFGVAGLSNDGTPAGTSGEFRITDSVANTITDTLADDLPTSGLTQVKDLAKLDAINGAPIEVRVDTTGVTYNETEAFRTIYVDTDADGAPDFAFTYKASLEGKILEYSVAGGTSYELANGIDSVNTFDNPVVGTQITGTVAIPGTSQSELHNDNNVSAMDYDFSDNPPLSSEFSFATNRDVVGANQLKVYGYDAVTQMWQVFDTGNTANTNDFDTLVKGKGYWGRLDDGDSAAGLPAAEGGLVLGTPALSTTDYATAGLANGWNLIAFDGVNSNIRNSATGMIVTFSTAAAGSITIKDSSGNHSVKVTDFGAADTSDVIAKKINTFMYSSEVNGTIPYTFDLRAYPSNHAAGEVTLISNKRFTLADDATDNIDGVTSLTGGSLYHPTTNVLKDMSADDVNTTGIRSVYGESIVIIEPLVAAGTANQLGASVAVAKVTGDTTTATVAYTDVNATILETGIRFTTHADFAGALGLVTGLDLDINGTADHLLLASVAPFTIQDHTFTRTYAYTDSGTASSINIVNSGTQTGTVAIATGSSNAVEASAIKAQITAADGSAYNDGATGNVFIITNDSGAQDFSIQETTADNLQPGSSNSNFTKGSVGYVYSADYLAKKPVNNIVDINITRIPDNHDDNVTFSYVTQLGTLAGSVFTPNPLDATGIALTYEPDGETDADVSDILDDYTTQINADLDALGLTATATAVYVDSTNLGKDMNNSYIRITGTDVIGVTTAVTDAALNAPGGAGLEPITDATDITADTGYITALVGDLSLDLKFNSVKSPDYVLSGPLYTMRDNNMTLKALVSTTMDLSSGTTEWESIDLTRNPSEWLDSQDYNLFDVDSKAGYWAYLQLDSSVNPITISTIELSRSITHYFDAPVAPSTTGTTTNHYAGVLDVEVSGLNDDDNREAVRVTALVGSKRIELTNSTPTSNAYTGKVSISEIQGLQANTAYEIVIEVADGLGNNYTKTYSTLFDNVKPTVPTVAMVNGELNISHTDVNVTGFYVFNAVIPEQNTESSKVAFLSEAGAVGVVCETLADVAWNTAAGGLNVIALDGNGTLGLGNASDSKSVAFMPILRDRILITDVNNAGVIDATGGGTDYNTSCASQGAITVNTGVTLTAITTDTTAKLAYRSLGEQEVTAVPVTIYLKDTAGTVVKVTYPETYANATTAVARSFFVEIDGSVYGFEAITQAAIDGNPGETSANALDVNAQLKSDISL